MNHEIAQAKWKELKASWLQGYPFDADYEIAFIKGYADSETWVADYLSTP
jgi:hypothetical protein